MPLITAQDDPRAKSAKYLFGVGIDQPLYAMLSPYGTDGDEEFFVWLTAGNMDGLCSGIEAGVAEAYGRGWRVYGFNTPEEAFAAARDRSNHLSESETVSLYFCALSLAENAGGEQGELFRAVCRAFSDLQRSLGHDRIADDFAAMAAGNLLERS